jgi:uncharacterized protein with PIN domain
LANQDVKFAADRMLGRLVKWLRIIGQDTIYGPHLSGYGLIRAARADDRLILTRDRGLKRKHPPALLFIVSDHYRDQLRQVIRTCDLKVVEERLFSRCLRCNSVLQSAPKEFLAGQVPAYVFSSQQRFFSCPVCRRIYWPATHHARMLEEIKNLGFE